MDKPQFRIEDIHGMADFIKHVDRIVVAQIVNMDMVRSRFQRGEIALIETQSGE